MGKVLYKQRTDNGFTLGKLEEYEAFSGGMIFITHRAHLQIRATS